MRASLKAAAEAKGKTSDRVRSSVLGAQAAAAGKPLSARKSVAGPISDKASASGSAATSSKADSSRTKTSGASDSGQAYFVKLLQSK